MDVSRGMKVSWQSVVARVRGSLESGGTRAVGPSDRGVSGRESGQVLIAGRRIPHSISVTTGGLSRLLDGTLWCDDVRTAGIRREPKSPIHMDRPAGEILTTRLPEGPVKQMLEGVSQTVGTYTATEVDQELWELVRATGTHRLSGYHYVSEEDRFKAIVACFAATALRCSPLTFPAPDGERIPFFSWWPIVSFLHHTVASYWDRHGALLRRTVEQLMRIDDGAFAAWLTRSALEEMITGFRCTSDAIRYLRELITIVQGGSNGGYSIGPLPDFFDGYQPSQERFPAPKSGMTPEQLVVIAHRFQEQAPTIVGRYAKTYDRLLHWLRGQPFSVSHATRKTMNKIVVEHNRAVLALLAQSPAYSRKPALSAKDEIWKRLANQVIVEAIVQQMIAYGLIPDGHNPKEYTAYLWRCRKKDLRELLWHTGSLEMFRAGLTRLSVDLSPREFRLIRTRGGRGPRRQVAVSHRGTVAYVNFGS